VVVDGVLLALAADADLQVLLAGPVAAADLVLAGVPSAQRSRVSLAPARQGVRMGEDPALAVHTRRDASVRVLLRALRDRDADAAVSVGSTGAALTAAVLELGRLQGVDRPALAAVVPAAAGPLVLLDVGANLRADPALIGQHALLGVAHARQVLGIARPRVGLLSTGHEPGTGGAPRRRTAELLTTLLRGLPAEFVGNVEAHSVPLGGPADVVVTDGFSGNVLLKGMEGTVDLVRRRLPAAAGAAAEAALPDAPRAAVLLGVRGAVVVGHGSAGPDAVAACIAVAAAAVRTGLHGATAADHARLHTSAGPRGVLEEVPR